MLTHVRGLVLGLVASAALATASPAINVTFTPHLNDASAYSVDAEMVISAPNIGVNATLVTMYLWVAGIPTQRYDGDALQVSDANGALPLTTTESGTEGVIQSRFWNTERATSGDVALRFTFYPRVLNGSEWGPLFDTRTQDGGLLGSMVTVLPSWDLSDTPANTRIATTFGEYFPKTFDTVLQNLVFSLWAVGDIHSYPEVTTPDTDFATYWFEEPTFNTSDVAGLIQNFYENECDFFNQTSDVGYHVFFRNQTSSGGTAFYESFIYGPGSNPNTTSLDIEYVLAHEISHNFLEFDDSVVNSTTISEGWAEYYSMRLLWRSKMITDQQYLDVMNNRVSYYYNDIYVNLTDTEVQDNPWGDLAVQKIPYGRGLIYLTNVDAEMRERHQGAKSVDTLTMGMIERKKAGLSHGLEDWFNLLREYLGEEAVDNYIEVASGTPLLALRQGTLSPCFEVVQTSEEPVAYQWQFKTGCNKSCII
ncbi:hypothetical protein GQ53DRAFT_802816 [Thozetella sp. PMI_491]|nr:hypothetical protein GQ53DRAFT_802816 [Thozetella sp. PMI_491]